MARQIKRTNTWSPVLEKGDRIVNAKPSSCAQRIEAATTVKPPRVVLTERQSHDAEELFGDCDSEGTALLSRGQLTELLREIGLEEALKEAFKPSSRIAFDAHSADSHFLSLQEFKRLYCLIMKWCPTLLPRKPFLRVTIVKARNLPAADVNGKSDPLCIWQIAGRSRSKSRTRHIDKELNPVWNEEFDDKYTYKVGDNLEFTVYDYDPPTGGKADKPEDGDLLGRASLASHEFHTPGGFDGEVRLSAECGTKGPPAFLKIRVQATCFDPQ